MQIDVTWRKFYFRQQHPVAGGLAPSGDHRLRETRGGPWTWISQTDLFIEVGLSQDTEASFPPLLPALRSPVHQVHTWGRTMAALPITR